jgi:DNA-binding response OmpR family regulator
MPHNTTPIQVLFVSADFYLQAALERHLSHKEFAKIVTATTGFAGLRLLHRHRFDLLLLDQRVSDFDPMDLVHTILDVWPATKIVLVLEKDEVVPVAALHMGIAASINRNFPLGEWTGVLTYVLYGGSAFSRATVRAVLDESEAVLNNDLNPNHMQWADRLDVTSPLQIGPLRIDLARRSVKVGEKQVQLTPQEFALLVCLVKNVDRVVTFDKLLNDAWGYDANNGSPAQVRLYVARLRKKLTDASDNPQFIINERSVGYSLRSNTFGAKPRDATVGNREAPVALFMTSSRSCSMPRAAQEDTLRLKRMGKGVISWWEHTTGEIQHTLENVAHRLHDELHTLASHLHHLYDNVAMHSVELLHLHNEAAAGYTHEIMLLVSAL